MTYRIFAALLGLGVIVIAGCGGDSALKNKTVDYKSAAQQTTPPLEVPPDLPTPTTSDRYSVPDAPGKGTATYSEYSQEKPARAAQQQGVLPVAEGAQLERAGTQRWLVVDQSPDAVWPVLKEFWQQQGFIIATDNPEAGFMQTDWAENRAKIPQGWVRNLLGKVSDQVYATPERDRYRTRIERGTKPGTTEIYITHRGAYEVYVADANLRQTGKTMWQPMPPDPDLEAEMLTRLMVKFGVKQEIAAARIKDTKFEPRAVLSKGEGGVPVLTLTDDFDHGWRRVGLSLDRLGFTVQDRDRKAGTYFVRYVNPGSVPKDSSFLSKLAFWDTDVPAGKAADYRISVVGAGTTTRVTVVGTDGKPMSSEVAGRILTVLQEDLK